MINNLQKIKNDVHTFWNLQSIINRESKKKKYTINKVKGTITTVH